VDVVVRNSFWMRPFSVNFTNRNEKENYFNNDNEIKTKMRGELRHCCINLCVL